MKNLFSRLFTYILTAAFLLLLNSCAGVQLKAISSSPPTAKLRVYVQPISAPFPFPTGAGAWDSSHKGFVARQISGTERFLKQTGIYEVVPEQDVKEVLGGQNPSYIEMSKNNWALSRAIGKALYSEYVLVIERRMEPDKRGGVDLYFTINLINTSSGKLYEASTRLDTFDRASNEKMMEIIKKLFRTVFLSAKNDMFKTAVKKSENIYAHDKEIAAGPNPEPFIIPQAPKSMPQVPSSVPEKPVTPPEPKLIAAALKPQPPVIQQAPKAIPQAPPKVLDKPVAPPESKLILAAPKPEPLVTAPVPEVKLPVFEPAKIPNTTPVKPRHEDISGMDRLVIYDLEAPEQYRTVALIVTEVLREELFLLNKFILINRENLLDVLREMALQQSGLIDEKQAVKAGKGLAANQIVTGSLGLLGKTYLLNAKRIDVETFATLGQASTRFVKGQEEDVLGRLPGLAKSLAGMQ
jgi:hypothetical protein